MSTLGVVIRFEAELRLFLNLGGESPLDAVDETCDIDRRVVRADCESRGGFPIPYIQYNITLCTT